MMPNYYLIENKKIINLGFFICDMEADQYAIDTYRPAKGYLITDNLDYLNHKEVQMEQQNTMEQFV